MIRIVSLFVQHCRHSLFKRALAITLSMLSFAALARAQNWTAVTNPSGVRASTALLLTDGSVMVQQMTVQGNNLVPTGQWWRLIPDHNGSYANVFWTPLASMPSGYGPLYYGSAVLPDGRVVVVGGEFNLGNLNMVETNMGAIYNPTTNSWTSITPPAGFSQIGDAASVVLPNGTFMLGDCCSATQHLLNASNLTWTSTGSGKADSNSEEGWTLLPNGKVLTIDTSILLNSELYNPSTGSWSATDNTKVSLISSSEIGPAVLRPDGTVFATGANSSTAVYNAGAATWSIGPTIPSGLGVPDGPAAILPNGNVLVDTSPVSGGVGSHFFEFNGTSLLSVPSPPNAPNDKAFFGRMLVLPTGQVLFTDGTTQVELYTASGTFQNAWRPTITSVASSFAAGSVNNAISGTQFNGLSQGAAYGDDSQSATNYPLVRITNNATGHISYAKTHNHSTMAVATGAAIVSTQFDVAPDIEGGASTLQVVANGIPSSSAAVNVLTPASGLLGFAGQFSCLDQFTCDFGTISVTVNTTTKTISYDGAGFYSGTGYSFNGSPGIPQTIAQTIVSAFNSDPNSPVNASIIQDTYSAGYDVKFVAKQTGPGGNYPTSVNVISAYGTFQQFGPATIGWTWTPFPATGGIDPNTLTEVTPLSGTLTGGH